MKNIKYLVASTKSYYVKTLPIIIPSLIANNIAIEDILITISNCSENIKYKNFRTFCVNYNSFEYSALINLIDIHYSESDYVFLLHDTMLCGLNFKHLSQKFTRGCIVLAQTLGYTNMGAYNVNYLMSVKNKLLNLKNISKKYGISIEGKLFDCIPNFYDNPTIKPSNERKDIYGNGLKRKVDYYNSVDVTKFGANGPESLIKDEFIYEL